MQLTVTTLSDQIFSLEVGEDLDLASFKALCELEVGVPAHEIAILWKGQPLYDDRLTLKQYGIGDGDMLLLQQITGQLGQRHDWGGHRQSSGDTRRKTINSYLPRLCSLSQNNSSVRVVLIDIGNLRRQDCFQYIWYAVFILNVTSIHSSSGKWVTVILTRFSFISYSNTSSSIKFSAVKQRIFSSFIVNNSST